MHDCRVLARQVQQGVQTLIISHTRHITPGGYSDDDNPKNSCDIWAGHTLKRLLSGRLRYGHVSLPGTLSLSSYGKNASNLGGGGGIELFFQMHKCLFVTANLCNPYIFIHGLFLQPEHVQYAPKNFFKNDNDTW